MKLDSARARWLGAAVMPTSIRYLSSQVPVPVLASTESTDGALAEYLHLWITNPDPAGQFSAETRWIACLPEPARARMLFTLGYDGLLYVKDDTIIGHVFYQRHGGSIHGFSAAVNDAFDGNGYSVVMMLDFVAHAQSTPGVTRVRVGTGQNNLTRRFLERIKSHETDLAWHVSVNGWITFDGPSAVS